MENNEFLFKNIVAMHWTHQIVFAINHAMEDLWQRLLVLQIWPDFGKPTKLQSSHLVLREITILNIEATVAPLCWTVAMPDILY